MNALLNSSRFNLLPARDVSREMSRWINELTDDTMASAAPASIWEDDTHYHLEFDMPGVSADDVDIKIKENTLHLTAHRPMPDGVRFLRQERMYGTIERVFHLASRVDDAGISAELNHGVLRIDVAKAPESQVRKIEIKSGRRK